MKMKFPLLSATVAMVCLNLPTFADNTSSSTRASDNTATDTTGTQSSSDLDASRNQSSATTTGTSLRNQMNSAFWSTSQSPANIGTVERASKVLGWTVKNNQNDKLGKIEDMSIDMASGRIVEVIVASGGFLGIGEKFYAVPPAALAYDANQKEARLNMDKDRFKSAPEFEVGKWSDYSQPQRVREVYHYYGQDAYLSSQADANYRLSTSTGTGSAVQSPSSSSWRESSTNPNNNNTTSSTRTSDLNSSTTTGNRSGTTSDTDVTTRSATGTTENPGSTISSDVNRVGNDINQTAHDVGRSISSTAHNAANTAANTGTWADHQMSLNTLGNVESAKKVIGMSVRNPQNDKVGKVDDLMVDMMTGRIVEVIVSTGGFLGMGNTLSAVPPQAFQAGADRDALVLNVTKEQLTSNPHFDNSQWPQLGDPNYVSSIYNAYNVPPYWGVGATRTPSSGSSVSESSTDNTSTSVRPDNTGRNARDRDRQSVTADDQGNNASDVQLSSRIRRAITRDSNLSANAHNIKVVTENGRITLRGVVNSDDEKNRITQLVNQTAPNANVDNQLEVKSDTNTDKENNR